MPFIHLQELPKKEIWPGFSAQLHHSPDHTFGFIRIEEGAELPEHHHPHVQYTYILEGKLEFTIGTDTQIVESGMLAHIPSNVPHSAKALAPTLVVDTFHPVREDLRE
ncbi:MAG: cupin domain-containing protein [Bacteroidota bacterium]